MILCFSVILEFDITSCHSLFNCEKEQLSYSSETHAFHKIENVVLYGFRTASLLITVFVEHCINVSQ